MTDHNQSPSAEDLFRLLLDSVQDYAIFVLDTTGHVTSWNAGAERIKGYRPDEIIGRHFSVFYSPEDRAVHKPETGLRIAAEEGRFEDTGWRVRKDGSTFWANVVITALHEGGELHGFAKITRDITLRRYAELERERLLKQEHEARVQAETLARERAEFMAVAAHELKTPVTTIKGYAQWLGLQVAASSLDARARDGFTMMGRQLARLELLINDLLDTTRIQQGRLDLRPEDGVDLRAIAREAIALVEPVPGSSSKHHIVLDAPEPVFGHWDPARLEQVVTNLLTNALKYSPAGSEVRVRVSQDDDQAEVSVTDQGIGISADEQRNLFQPFSRAARSRRGVTGVGLGLYITAQIVERHGGDIHVESQPGEGATFTVRLPLHRSSLPDRTAGRTAAIENQ